MPLPTRTSNPSSNIARLGANVIRLMLSLNQTILLPINIHLVALSLLHQHRTAGRLAGSALSHAAGLDTVAASLVVVRSTTTSGSSSLGLGSALAALAGRVLDGRVLGLAVDDALLGLLLGDLLLDLAPRVLDGAVIGEAEALGDFVSVDL